MFKTSLLIFFVLLFCRHYGSAQVAAYSFAQTNATYNAISGGTVHGSSTIDDASYDNIALGFTFTYNCQNYTHISINCNGFISFGTSVSSSYTPISTGSSNNVVSALGFDIQGISTTGELRSQTIGTAPNRTFVVQWKNFRAYGATGDDYNFQIRLNETLNTIQIHYGAFTQNATNRFAEVGLRGGANTDFFNRRIVSGTHTWTSSANGGANNQTCELRTALIPDNGRRFTFTPTAAAMSYTSSTCTQVLTGTVKRCPANVQIARVQVVMGAGCPINLTQLVVGAAGSTNITGDVSSIKVYYTGSSTSFSTTNLVNSGGTAPVGASTTITGNVPLSAGSNYFWITYDMNGAAGVGNVIDASCTSITVNGSSHVPTVTNPAGNGTVVECAAPGGLTAGIETWLKADLGFGSGSPATWNNQAPGTATVFNGTSNPARNTTSTSYNYNPYIEFTGPSSVNTPGGAAANREFIRLSGYDLNTGILYRSLFFAFQLNNLTRTNTHIATTADVTTWGIPAVGGTLHGFDVGGVAAIHENGYNNVDFGASSLAGTWKRNGTNITHDALHTNSKQILSAVSSTTDGVTLNRFLGGQNDVSGFNGDGRDWVGPVVEIIGFTTQLSATDRSKVHSYLAIKYGITLSENYIATNGSSIYATTTPYNTNIIGIGRDDVEELNQKQSHQNDDHVRIYLNTLQTSNQANTGTFSQNISYVVQGSNTGAMCATSASNSEIPTGLGSCTLFSRLAREWKVTRTNMPETYAMDIRLDACAVPASVNVADLRLLVDNDGNFANGGTQCFYNGDGSGIVFSYTNPMISISGISTTHIPNNSTRFITIGSVSSATPLPVELTYFEAIKISNNQVDLVWETSTERDSDHFIVERSTNLTNWDFVGKLQAAGNSVLPILYNTKDFNPQIGINYYRLRQFDLDGAVSYSDIKSIEIQDDKLFSIHPNPANDVIKIAASSFENVTIQLVNGIGKTVWQSEGEIQGSYIQIDLGNFAEGIYFVQFNTRNSSEIQKLVIKK